MIQKYSGIMSIGYTNIHHGKDMLMNYKDILNQYLYELDRQIKERANKVKY